MWFSVIGLWACLLLRRLWRSSARAGYKLAADQAGQSMVEYAIVAALIAALTMAAVPASGGGIAQVFQNILGNIQGVG